MGSGVGSQSYRRARRTDKKDTDNEEEWHRAFDANLLRDLLGRSLVNICYVRNRARECIFPPCERDQQPLGRAVRQLIPSSGRRLQTEDLSFASFWYGACYRLVVCLRPSRSKRCIFFLRHIIWRGHNIRQSGCASLAPSFGWWFAPSGRTGLGSASC